MMKSTFFLSLAATLFAGQVMANDVVTLPEGASVKQYELGCLVAEHPAHVQVAQVDNELYVQGLCAALPEAWVKGTIEGNTVTMPSQQYVGVANDAEGVATELYFVGTDDNLAVQPLTLEYHPENDTYEAYYQYICFTNETLDHTFSSMRDVFFLTDNRELVELPADVDQMQYRIEGKYVDMDKPFSSYINIAFSRNTDEIFFQGLSEQLPEAWVRGTVDEDGLVHLRNTQYLGEYQGKLDTYNIWMKGMDSNKAFFTDVTLSFDAADGVFTLTDDQWISMNASLTDFEWFTLLGNLVLTPLEEEHDFYALVTPPAGLETESYAVSGLDYSFGIDMADPLMDYDVQVGFDGNDVYVKGLFLDIEDAWVKGTLSDGVVTFSYPQYLGLWWDMMDTWMMGVNSNEEAVAVTMSYDPVANRFEQNDETMIYFNDDPLSVSIMPLQIIGQVALQGEAHTTCISAIEPQQKASVVYDLFGRQIKDVKNVGLVIKK